MNTILSTSYWPTLHYFYYLINSDDFIIEIFDHYQKQSFRNRFQILSANGKLDLSIPVKKKNPKQLIRDIAISHETQWQMKHWRAITSAYMNSPYFEFFEDEIRDFYFRKHESLLEYNTLQLECILKILRIPKKIKYSSTFEKSPENYIDLREVIHPKKDFRQDPEAANVLSKPYYQTFGSKFPFTPNLSVLDLLFNLGLESKDYLTVKQ